MWQHPDLVEILGTMKLPNLPRAVGGTDTVRSTWDLSKHSVAVGSVDYGNNLFICAQSADTDGRSGKLIPAYWVDMWNDI